MRSQSLIPHAVIGQMVQRALFLKCLLILLATTGPVAAQNLCRLAILGDSLTAGYGLEIASAFPTVLERELVANSVPCKVIDAGVSGDTTAGGVSRVDWVLAADPTHLMVELGGNDALRALPTEQMKANLEKIIEASRARGVPVMLAGMLPPPNLGEHYFDAFRLVFTDLADKYGLYLYPFFLDGVALEPSLMQADGIHPNAEGVQEIVRRITPLTIQFVQTGYQNGMPE
ncbi:MAG: arylesterase [Pseudomonadota bacterium]